MQCEIRQGTGYSVVELSGEVDLATSPRARKAILDRIAARDAVYVDMAGVTYIDSSGVASLVEGYQHAKNRKQRFALVDVSSTAVSVLELARLDKVFPIFSSLEECLSAEP